MTNKPRIKKSDDSRIAELRRYVRGIQKLAAEIDPKFALEIADEIRRKKKIEKVRPLN